MAFIRGHKKGIVDTSDFDEKTGIIDFDALKDGDDEDINAMDADAQRDLLLDETDESKECLLESEDPTRRFQYPLISEEKAPGGIPHQCLKQMWSQALWYRRLRCLFLVSEKPSIQCGTLRGFLGLHFERFRHLTTYPYVIHPYSDFSACWNFSVGLFTAINLIYSPYMIAFEPINFVDAPFFSISFILSTVLLLDIGVTFWTGAFDKYSHTVNLQPGKIAHQYLTGWFTFDLLSRFPFDALMIVLTPEKDLQQKSKLDTIRLVAFFSRVLRYQKVYSVLCRVSDTFSFRSMVTPFVLKVVLLIIYTTHFHACFHWLLPDIVNAHYDHPKPKSWITSYGIWDKSEFSQYINAYLRSLSNLLTLDGGNFIPRETEEIGCTIIGIFLSVSMFGYFISSISTLLSQINASAEKYEKMVDLVEVYLKFQKIPDQLQQKVYQYFEKKHRGHVFSDSAILATLSPNLRTEIACHNCRGLVQKVPLFQKLPPSVIVNLVEKLEYEVYITGDVLVSPAIPGNSMFFIQDGELNVLSVFGQKMYSLKDGDFFGEMSLIAEDQRTKTVVAVSPCEVYKLSRADFRHCVEFCEDIYAEILSVAQQKLDAERQANEEAIRKSENLRNWKKAAETVGKLIEEENRIEIDETAIELVGDDGSDDSEDFDMEFDAKTRMGVPPSLITGNSKLTKETNALDSTGDKHNKVAAIKGFFKHLTKKK